MGGTPKDRPFEGSESTDFILRVAKDADDVSKSFTLSRTSNRWVRLWDSIVQNRLKSPRPFDHSVGFSLPITFFPAIYKFDPT